MIQNRGINTTIIRHLFPLVRELSTAVDGVVPGYQQVQILGENNLESLPQHTLLLVYGHRSAKESFIVADVLRERIDYVAMGKIGLRKEILMYAAAFANAFVVPVSFGTDFTTLLKGEAFAAFFALSLYQLATRNAYVAIERSQDVGSNRLTSQPEREAWHHGLVKAQEELVERMDNNGLAGAIWAEGTRSRNGKYEGSKKGIAYVIEMLGRQTELSVVPVISSEDFVPEQGDDWFNRYPFYIQVQKPIHVKRGVEREEYAKLLKKIDTATYKSMPLALSHLVALYCSVKAQHQERSFPISTRDSDVMEIIENTDQAGFNLKHTEDVAAYLRRFDTVMRGQSYSDVEGRITLDSDFARDPLSDPAAWTNPAIYAANVARSVPGLENLIHQVIFTK